MRSKAKKKENLTATENVILKKEKENRKSL